MQSSRHTVLEYLKNLSWPVAATIQNKTCITPSCPSPCLKSKLLYTPIKDTVYAQISPLTTTTFPSNIHLRLECQTRSEARQPHSKSHLISIVRISHTSQPHNTPQSNQVITGNKAHAFCLKPTPALAPPTGENYLILEINATNTTTHSHTPAVKYSLSHPQHSCLSNC